MKENITKIPANPDEILVYAFTGEALWKVQHVEQALNILITLKMNSDKTRKEVDMFLNEHQKYTLGKAIKTAKDNNLLNSSTQDELNTFLKLRNWLVHKSMWESQIINSNKKNIHELIAKLKSISDKAENIQSMIEYDMIEFSESRGRDMSKIRELLKLQEKGIRVQI